MFGRESSGQYPTQNGPKVKERPEDALNNFIWLKGNESSTKKPEKPIQPATPIESKLEAIQVAQALKELKSMKLAALIMRSKLGKSTIVEELDKAIKLVAEGKLASAHEIAEKINNPGVFGLAAQISNTEQVDGKKTASARNNDGFKSTLSSVVHLESSALKTESAERELANVIVLLKEERKITDKEAHDQLKAEPDLRDLVQQTVLIKAIKENTEGMSDKVQQKQTALKIIAAQGANIKEPEKILATVFPDASVEKTATPQETKKTEALVSNNPPTANEDLKAAKEITMKDGTSQERLGLTDRTIKEMSIIMNATKEQAENNVPMMRRQAFETALNELILNGTYDNKAIESILEKYKIGDPNSAANKALYPAFLETIELKKQEIAHLAKLRDNAEQQYDRDKTVKNITISKEKFVERFIATNLLNTIIDGQPVKAGITREVAIAEKKARKERIRSAMEAGEITMYYPTIDNIVPQGMYVSPAAAPTFVLSDAGMKIITDNPDAAPRGQIFALKNAEGVDFSVIAIHVNANPATLKHEMAHMIYSLNRNLLKNKYTNQVARSIAPRMIERFANHINPKPTPEGDKKNQIKKTAAEEFAPAEIEMMQKAFAELVAKGNINGLTELNNLPPDTKNLIQQFEKYCTTNPEGKKPFEAVKKIYQETKKEYDSPLEELLTLGCDMQQRIGLGNLFTTDFLNPDHTDKTAAEIKTFNEQKQTALAIMRMYNRLWGTGQGEDRAFYEANRDLLTQLIRQNMKEHVNFTFEGFVKMIHDLKAKSEKGVPGSTQLYNALGLNLDEIIIDLGARENLAGILSSETFKALQEYNTALKNTDANLSETKKLLLLNIRNDVNLNTNFKNGIERLLTDDPDNQNATDIATYLAFGLEPTEQEKEGSYGATVFEKRSGPNSYWRNFFDRDDRFGKWGKPNYYTTPLESVPLVGPVIQGLWETINLNHKVYTHYKDIGPFGQIPWLNLKYLRELKRDDPKKIIDSNDPIEAVDKLFGTNFSRSKFRKSIDKLFWGITKERKAYSPEALMQPGLDTYYGLTLKQLGLALTKAGIAQSQQRLVYSVIGGVSVNQGQLEGNIQDWSKIDEFRMNYQLSEFTDEINRTFHKGDEWHNTWKERLSKDKFIDLDDNETEIEFDEHGKSNYRINKGTMTEQLMKDICASIQADEPQEEAYAKIATEREGRDVDMPEMTKRKRAQFEGIAKAMMTADLQNKANQHAKGYTLEDLAQAIISSDNDDRLLQDRFKGSGGYTAEAVQDFIDNPTVIIKVPNADGTDHEVIATIDARYAKEFIAHYYLARLRTITSVGIWGISDTTPQGVVARSYNPDATDTRDYSLTGKRKLSDTDETNLYLMPQDLVDPLQTMSAEIVNMLNGTQGMKYGDLYTTAVRENMSHDSVTGALKGGREGRELAYKFTAKLRQAEAFRDMAKTKKEVWEGTNNIDDTLRFLTLMYCIATVLVPGAGWAFNPNILLGLLGWSMTVSPFINRAARGWSARDRAGGEAVVTMLGDQYKGFYYNLAEDVYHPVNEIREAGARYESIKKVYKSLVEDLSKHGTTNSNYISRKANDLIGQFL